MNKQKLFITIFAIFFLVNCSGQGDQKETASSDVSEPKQETMIKVDYGPVVQPNNEEIKMLVKYFKNKYGARLPEGTVVKVGEIENSSFPGFDKGKYLVNISGRGEQEIPFLLSKDKRHVVIGVDTPTDTTTFSDSPVAGIKQGEIPYGRSPLPILITADGKSFIVGELLDITVDPFKKVLDQISFENVPVKGDENAQITIVEYSDFQCPFCRRGSEMLPKLLSDYKGKVKIYFKQFPLPNHNWAKDASVASLCSYKQGNEKFWDFHDTLFYRQREISLVTSEEKFKEIAGEIGLDIPKFEECIKSDQFDGQIDMDMAEGQKIGVNSTPTFVVDGMIVRGADFQSLKTAIDSRLSGDS